MSNQQNEFVDSRAITPIFLDVLKDENGLKFIPDIVRKDKEIELCFRGNNGDNIVLYHHNHCLLKLKKCKRGNRYTVTVSLNHARYLESRDKAYKELRELGIKNKADKFPDNGYLSANFVPHDLHKILPSVIRRMKEILNNYFDNITLAKVQTVTDKFENKKVGHGTKFARSENLEKRRQLEIMHCLKNINNGYFVYDLEFQQKHKNNADRKNDDNNNEPDMQALKFENGKPIALTFIEVKSTEAACKGDSGIKNHLDKMIDYIKNKDSNKKHLKDRIEEAAEIFKQYKDLGLRGLINSEADTTVQEIRELSVLSFEPMFIFTDGVEKKIKKYLPKIEDREKLVKYFILMTWSKKDGLKEYKLPE